MKICKLCLELDALEDEDKEEPNLNELQIIQNLIPQLVSNNNLNFRSFKYYLFQNNFLNTDLIICLVCTNVIKAIGKFLNNIKQVEQKIEMALSKDKLKKIDIKSLHSKVNKLPLNLKDHVAVCRLCLKFIAKPSIFLCESKTNIMGHGLIKKMLQFCNVNLVSINL